MYLFFNVLIHIHPFLWIIVDVFQRQSELFSVSIFTARETAFIYTKTFLSLSSCVIMCVLGSGCW